MVGIILVQNLLHSQGIKIIHFDEHDNDIDDGHNNDIELIKKKSEKKEDTKWYISNFYILGDL